MHAAVPEPPPAPAARPGTRLPPGRSTHRSRIRSLRESAPAPTQAFATAECSLASWCTACQGHYARQTSGGSSGEPLCAWPAKCTDCQGGPDQLLWSPCARDQPSAGRELHAVLAPLAARAAKSLRLREGIALLLRCLARERLPISVQPAALEVVPAKGDHSRCRSTKTGPKFSRGPGHCQIRKSKNTASHDQECI